MEDVLRTKGVRWPIQAVRAKQGKAARAEPVAAAFMDAGVALNTPVKWGGMWPNFEDIPHIELITPPQKNGAPKG